MADARALLRAERQSRRITHPHASYTSDGKLLCNLCETLVKSEAQWGSHLHSTQHTLRSQRVQEAGRKRKADRIEVEEVEAVEGGKKRKADSFEEDGDGDQGRVAEGRKKVKAGVEDDQVEDVETMDGPQESPPASQDERTRTTAPLPSQPRATTNDIDEAELLAFERELADLAATQLTQPASALTAAPNISANAMTAADHAAQAREEASAQRGQRDAELEDEREDAARVLEEEFEEMEGLEERVKRLRERREALRQHVNEGDAAGVGAGMDEGGGEEVAKGVNDGSGSDEHEDGDEHEDDDEGVGWGFGAG